MQQLITNDARARVVCERCVVADRPHTRLRGLLGRAQLEAGEGLLLKPTPSVHTCFMRFTIDAVFLDAQLRVVSVAPALRPWRSRAGAARVRCWSLPQVRLRVVGSGREQPSS